MRSSHVPEQSLPPYTGEARAFDQKPGHISTSTATEEESTQIINEIIEPDTDSTDEPGHSSTDHDDHPVDPENVDDEP